MADKFGCTEGEWEVKTGKEASEICGLELTENEYIMSDCDTYPWIIAEICESQPGEHGPDARHMKYSKRMRNALIKFYKWHREQFETGGLCDCGIDGDCEFCIQTDFINEYKELIESVTEMSIDDAIKAYEKEKK